MMSVEEGLAHILTGITPLPAIHIPLSEALGLTLAEDIIAADNIPPFSNSAMDGFALRSQDSIPTTEQPRRLKVTGTIAAGHVTQQEVTENTAMRIMTGAPIPPGADTVLEVEKTHNGGPNSDWVDILKISAPGNNIRQAGSDVRQGQRVLQQGTQITSWEIGLLASLGCANLAVIPRARVAILATGDEIINIDQPLQPGQIRNSNSYLIEAAVRQAGAEAHRIGIAHDTKESLREKFREASNYDLIITSGGVSVGEFDLVKQIMQEQGTINFWRINMRPGKPIAFGTINGTPLLGLPGNPVSTAITFELFGRPLIRKMQGQQHLTRQQIEVTVADGFNERSERRHYIRAHVQWQGDHFVAHTTGKQASHMQTSLLHANALLMIQPSANVVQPGDKVKAIMLDWPEYDETHMHSTQQHGEL